MGIIRAGIMTQPYNYKESWESDSEELTLSDYKLLYDMAHAEWFRLEWYYRPEVPDHLLSKYHEDIRGLEALMYRLQLCINKLEESNG